MTSAVDSSKPPGQKAGLRRFILPAAFVGILFGTLWSRQQPANDSKPTAEPTGSGVVLGGEALGTTWSVKSPEAVADLPGVVKALDEVLADVDASMSTWRSDSELSQFNRSGTAPISVSAHLLEVLIASEAISIASNGAFDVTVGPLVAAWGFGANKEDGPPSEKTLASLLERVGYKLLSISAETGTVTRLRTDVSADLSAIAKGHAVDRLAGVLAGAGLDNWMVEVGGEVRVSGKNADGRSWRLGIEKPVPGGRVVAYAVELTSGALATSGDYRQFRMVDGQMVSHTIDPRTGKPVTHGPASASVIAKDCMTADAWATAMMVLGPKGLELATAQGLAVLMLERRPDGTLEEHMNDAFRSYLVPR